MPGTTVRLGMMLAYATAVWGTGQDTGSGQGRVQPCERRTARPAGTFLIRAASGTGLQQVQGMLLDGGVHSTMGAFALHPRA